MTMTLTLAIMLTLPQSHLDRDETPEQRAALIKPWADGIDAVSRNAFDRAALVAIAWHESGGFARYVLEHRCSDGPRGAKECDSGHARGAFQVHPWCKATTVEGEAQCAASAYRFALSRCGDNVSAFGQYASGNACRPMPQREKTRLMVLRRMGDS